MDDGSTDGSGDILDNYLCSHLHVVHKENGGLRSARISGLSVAKGDYISFIDSDDWVDEGIYEKFVFFLNQNEHVDVCCSDMVRNTDEKEYRSTIKKGTECFMGRNEALEHMIHEDLISWTLCAKLYRRILFETDLPKDRIEMAEDLDWNWVVFKNVRTVFYTPEFRYHYYVNQESMTGMIRLNQMTKHLVFKRIVEDQDDFSQLIRQYFIDRYVKELPMVMLESMLSGRMDDIPELREEFILFFPRVSIKDSFDVTMVRSIIESNDSCEGYIKQTILYIMDLARSVLETQKKVFVYGTGIIADHLYRWQNVYGLIPDGYVVSDGQINKKTFRKKTVYEFSDVKNYSKEAVFILALSKKIQDEVSRTLLAEGVENIYRLRICQ